MSAMLQFHVSADVFINYRVIFTTRLLRFSTAASQY